MQSLIDKGKSNETFLLFIETHANDDDYTDWRITVCFYSAMHYVKAYLKMHGIHTNSHKQIDIEIDDKGNGAHKFERTPYTIYSDLHDNAGLARYSGVFNTAAQAIYMKGLSKTAKASLKQIKTYLKGKNLNL